MARISRFAALSLALAAALLSPLAHIAFAQKKPKSAEPGESPWEKRMHARYDALVKQYGDGTDSALASRLMSMRKRDQDVRMRLFMDQNFNSLPPDQRKGLNDDLTPRTPI